MVPGLFIYHFARLLKESYFRNYQSYTIGEYYVICNTMGVFASAAGLIVSAYGIHLSFVGVLNEALKGQSYNYLVCCAAFFSLELGLMVFGFFTIGWREAYSRIFTFRQFMCIKW